MHAILAKVDLIAKAQGKRVVEEEIPIGSTNHHERQDRGDE